MPTKAIPPNAQRARPPKRSRLWEVAASTHSWEELSPHVPAGPARALAAHERVVRGEDLTGEAGIDRGVLDLPLGLQPWEPAYPVAVFHAEKADFPGPARPGMRPLTLSGPARVVEDEQTLEALFDLARTWAEQSNGKADAVVVEGSAEAAIAALCPEGALAAGVDASWALAAMAWARG